MKAGTMELMKFRKLQRKLKCSRAATAGILATLWYEVARNCPKGDVGRFSDEDIAVWVDWDGDPSALVSALVEYAWLDTCPVNRIVVHDWEDHAPNYVKGNVTRMGGFVSPQGTLPKGPSPGDPPLTTCVNQVKSSLVKSSLVKSLDTGVPVSAQTSTETKSGPPPVLVFPCSGVTPDWKLSQSQVDCWQNLFPQLDVLAECRAALAWVDANHRKTSRGMPRFIVSWLNRAVASLNAGPRTRVKPQVNLDEISRQADAIVAQRKAEREAERLARENARRTR